MSNISQQKRIIQNFTILIIDSLCIIAAFFAAAFTYDRLSSFSWYSKAYLFAIVGALFCNVLFYFLLDFNQNIFLRGYIVELVAILKYNCVLIFALSFCLFLTHLAKDFSRLTFLYFFIYNIALTYLSHILMKKFFLSVYRSSKGSSKLYAITTAQYVEDIISRLTSSAEWYHETVGAMILGVPYLKASEIQGVPIINVTDDLFEHFRTQIIDEVFIHLPEYHKEELSEMIVTLESMGISVHVNIDFSPNVLAHKTTESFSGFTVLSYEASTFDYRRLFIKRLMDICGGLLGSLITLILTPFIALAICIDSRGPVFFSQKRVGKNGRYFKMYKFRSMYVDAEARKKELMEQNEMNGLMFKMENDPRVTKVGAFLRKTSLDELPQFFNILFGSMSLIGTRPPTVDEFKQYDLFYRRRLSIKPGLTGLWQVSGRSDITDFKDVVKLDLEYIDNWSLSLDLKIIIMTFIVVLTGKGAK